MERSSGATSEVRGDGDAERMYLLLLARIQSFERQTRFNYILIHIER